jgi:hypothetical protein
MWRKEMAMLGNDRRAGSRRGAYLLLGMIALASGGCLAAAAAGVAGGAGLAYLYYQGNVSETYHAAFEDTRAATRTALADLGMPVIEEKTDKGGGGFETRTFDGYTVHVSLDSVSAPNPADGPQTRVGIRVATFGDKTVSDRIQRQISAHLAPAAVVAVPPAGAPAGPPVPITQVGTSPGPLPPPTPPPPLITDQR